VPTTPETGDQTTVTIPPTPLDDLLSQLPVPTTLVDPNTLPLIN